MAKDLFGRKKVRVKTVSSTELRLKARDIIESARYEGQHFIVETFGKPMVAIIGINEYETLMELEQTLEALSPDTAVTVRKPKV